MLFVCRSNVSRPIPALSQRASSPPLSSAAPSLHSVASALSPAVFGALSLAVVAARTQMKV